MVERWDIVTIGNLSRNRYWGESDGRAVRPAMCTSTLLRGGGFCLLVDPPIADARRMAVELDRRTGLRPADVGLVFITHSHADHHAGLGNFPQARWLAAEAVAAEMNSSNLYQKPLEGLTGHILDAVEVIATPGHTLNHHSLGFTWEGLRIVVAGDAVMTRDFWQDRRGFLNSVDLDMASKTIDSLAARADAIVPGHDNWFLVQSEGPRGK